MPTIASFSGVLVKMYYRDHQPPHFHAYYQGFEAQYEIRSGKILKGKMPRKVDRLISKWCERKRFELQKNWIRTKENEPLKWVSES